jgi:MoaA/NifB/PqqE/SkfB family radical SAM enzyme
LSRSGAHWFDRSTGLNVLLDDVDVPPARWHLAPRYMSIALTNACELRCAFCYAPKRPARLDADTVVEWLVELDENGCLGVGFGGGEPTAHPRFVELCERAASQTNLAVTFTTHGHRINEEIAACLRGSVNFIRVSMDGVGGTYERLRGRPFSEFRRNLEVIASICPFALNVIINRDTVDELDDVAEFAHAAGARELLLLPQQPTSYVAGIDDDSSRRFEDWVSRAPRHVPLAISEAGASPALGLADPFGDEPALEAHAHIDADGLLKPNAYSLTGVQIRGPIVRSLIELRNGEGTT